MFRAHPIPHVGIAFQPKLERNTTSVEPFSFEERMEATRRKKEERIQELLKEESKVGFPLPSSCQ